ncbi:MAG TPA: hypothetical protein VFJ90_08360 [Candidatus Didemnitutus sp.]|nr:hypothetical protein [Candidatus Didemnitutus sp.]
MKAIKLLLAATIFAGFAASSFAGPGLDYWTSHKAITKAQFDAKSAGTKAQAAAVATTNCTACQCCQAKKS